MSRRLCGLYVGRGGSLAGARQAHSRRNATIGSTFVARRAGTYDANVATRPKSSDTATNVLGSSGVMPKSMPWRYREPAAAPTSPSATPVAVSNQPLPEDERQHLRALRAERHADADLLRALHHGVGEHAVDADRRQQTGDAGEHAEHHRVEAFARDGAGLETIHGKDRVDADVGIDRVSRSRARRGTAAAGSPSVRSANDRKPIALSFCRGAESAPLHQRCMNCR